MGVSSNSVSQTRYLSRSKVCSLSCPAGAVGLPDVLDNWYWLRGDKVTMTLIILHLTAGSNHPLRSRKDLFILNWMYYGVESNNVSMRTWDTETVYDKKFLFAFKGYSSIMSWYFWCNSSTLCFITLALCPADGQSLMWWRVIFDLYVSLSRDQTLGELTFPHFVNCWPSVSGDLCENIICTLAK